MPAIHFLERRLNKLTPLKFSRRTARRKSASPFRFRRGGFSLQNDLLVVVIGVWFRIQYFNGAAALTDAASGGGVAWWAHIGGFVAGVPLILALKGPKQDVRRRDRPGSVTVIRRRRR